VSFIPKLLHPFPTYQRMTAQRSPFKPLIIDYCWSFKPFNVKRFKRPYEVVPLHEFINRIEELKPSSQICRRTQLLRSFEDD